MVFVEYAVCEDSNLAVYLSPLYGSILMELGIRDSNSDNKGQSPAFSTKPIASTSATLFLLLKS